MDAAEAGLPHPAQGQRRHAGVGQDRVDAGHARAQGAGDPVRPAAGEHGRAQAVGVGVGQGDGVVGVAGPDHRQDRAEGLLPHDQGVSRHVDQHHRVDIGRVDRVRAADQRPGAAGEGVVQVPLDDLELPGQGHGPEVGPGAAARADAGGALDQLGQEPVVDRVDHVHPLDGQAGLAGVGHPAPDRLLGSGVQVGVGVDHHGVLAAQLQHQRGEPLGAGGHHLAAGGRRPGEGDLVHAGQAQGMAGGPVPGDHLEHRLVAHGLGEGVGQQAAHRRGQLARLEHHRVPGGQGVGDRPERGEHRVVPGADDPDHPEGLVLDRGGVVGQHQGAAGPARPEHPGRVAGRPVEVLDDHQDLDEGVGGGLAVLAVDKGDQLVGPADQQRLVGQQGPPAAVEAQPGPASGRLPGPCHGGRDLLGPVERERAHHLPGGRAGGVEGADAGRARCCHRHGCPPSPS